MENEYVIIGTFDNEDRPNAEIIYSDKSINNVMIVLGLISNYQILKQEDKEEQAEKIREQLEDQYGVNTYDLDIVAIDSNIYKVDKVGK